MWNFLTVVNNRDFSHGSIVVSIPRCGRGDPGSNPGRGRVTRTQSMWQAVQFFSFVFVSQNASGQYNIYFNTYFKSLQI